MTSSPLTTCGRPDVTIVVPVYGNADTLPALTSRVGAAMAHTGMEFRLLLVVDASPDESWSVVRELAAGDARVGGLLLADNVGQHAAVLAGFASAYARWFVVMDADLQDAPEAIPVLLERARQCGLTVFAQRRGRYERWDRLATSRLFKTAFRWISGVPSDVGTFFVVSGEVADAMRQVRARSPQVVVLAHHCSRQCETVPIRRAIRATGTSAYSSLGRVRAALRSVSCAVACRRAHLAGTARASSRPPRIRERVNV